MSIRLKVFWGIAFGIIMSGQVRAQYLISGNVLDSARVPVSNVTITYSQINSNIILGFCQTDKQGHFSITMQSAADSLRLKINHISYLEQVINVQNKTQEYTFFLTPKSFQLKDVVVEAPPVYKINDTINYNVKSFTGKEDKVIGDVIKKLPGIDIENGKILYQGKPIQEYLINGLNLLDSKYQLANNNLPVDAVLKVQVIENHQPIKILDSLVFSDRASLNLQLKKITVTGSGTVAGGYKPGLWNLSLVPMVFNKNFQTLNTLQSNNTGNDVTAELFNPSVSNNSLFSTQQDMSLPQVNFIDVEDVTNPPFTKKRWMNNHVNMVSSNIIRKLGNGLELKGNASFFNDHILERGTTLTTFFLPGQNVMLSELTDNSYNVNDVRAAFSLAKNESKIYFKDNIKFGRQWKHDNGFMVRNGTDDIYQKKGFKGLNFSNDFSGITFWGKQLVNFNSQVNYFENPQQLSVVPGPFATVLNNGDPFDRAWQTVFYKNFDMDNSISVIKGIKRWSVVPRVGVRYASQQMQSNIATLVGSKETALDGDFKNDISFWTLHSYLQLLTQYKARRVSFELTLPAGLRDFYINSLTVSKKTALHKATFEPRAFLKYNLSAVWEASISSRYSNQFGGITQLYNAYVLSTYNSLKRFNTTIPQSGVWENNLSVNYRNTLKSLFFNVVLGDREQFNDYLFAQGVDSKGVMTISLLNQKNNQRTRFVNGDMGKYVGNLKTTFKWRGRMSLSKFEQMINNELSPVHQKEYSTGVNIYNSALEFLSVGYDGNIKFNNGKIGDEKMEPVTTQKHSLSVSAFPIKYHTLAVNMDYYLNNLSAQQDQLFIDLTYRFFIPKAKLNLELTCNNILNRNMFSSIYSSSWSIIETNYQLRPRQFLIGTWFKF
jgi:hypothetical protein